MSANESTAAGSTIMAGSGVAAASGVGLPVAIGGFVVGAGLTLYGQIAGASAQAEAAEKQSHLKNMQADEMLSRQAINEKTMLEQSKRIEGEYANSFAATGGEGAGIGGQMEIHRTTLENIALTRRDAEFKANMIRMGAEIEMSIASDIKTASYISGAGTILTGAAQAYTTLKGPGQSKRLSGDYS